MQKKLYFLIDKVKKIYNKKVVLNIQTLRLEAGQFVVLMGKNGSGKSTLMRLLAQQELVDFGDIFFQDISLKKSDVQLNLHMAFITEEQSLPSKNNLNMWIDFYQSIEPKYDRSLTERLMKDLGVSLERNFFSLSRGQKMKALFCLEAGKRPLLYLLDEISAVLDSGSRWYLMNFLRQEVLKGCTVIMSTNIANEVQGFATQIVVLEEGQIKLDCEAEHLKQHFQKWLVTQADESIFDSHPEFRRIGFNGEFSIFLGRRNEYSEKTVLKFQKDQREITIADIQTFFTSDEHKS